MTRTLFTLLLALLLPQRLPALEPPAERYEDLRARAHDMGETDEGKAYEKRFSQALAAKGMPAALEECTKDTKAPYKINMVFVIAADGTAQRIIPAPDQPVSACVAKKLTGAKLPAPPKPDWMVVLNIKIEP